MAIYDLTPDPEPDGVRQQREYTVDIVAVHGLYEGQIETWTDPDSRICWLRDLLAHQIPEARILAYGYEAHASNSDGEGSSDRILAHAYSLMSELNSNRYPFATRRPIIFICHGLGGILVKQALACSNTSRSKQVDHRRAFFTSTYAILSLGTPHGGMSEEVLRAEAKMPPGGELSQISQALIEGSEVLQDINEQFSSLMKKFRIYFLWEQHQSNLGSSQGYVVAENSAAPNWIRAERAGIPANHSQMCKFTSADDVGFKLISSACKRYLRTAVNEVNIRWHKDCELLEKEREEEVAELLRHDSGLSIHGPSSPMQNVHFVVPRSASSMFTGREEIATLLRQKIVSSPVVRGSGQHKIFVVWGLGGSGKTQFCLKFVENNRDSFWGIFWIDASSESTAEMGFANLGKIANKDATFEAGKHWLSNCQHSWLLVIDNADKRDMDVSKYFPAGGRGHIILTTRNPNNVLHATIGEANFREMDEEDAITLLLRAVQPGTDDYKDPKRRMLAKPIVSALGCLALALIHAGATIRRRLYTLETYLRVYEKEMMLTTQLLPSSNTSSEQWKDRCIAATYEIPFKETKESPDQASIDAIEILNIFAFLHFQQIPEAIFRNAWNSLQLSRVPIPKVQNRISAMWPKIGGGQKQDTSSAQHPLPGLLLQSTWDDRRLNDALAVLYDLSFIYYDDVRQMCWMHPMVHLWARNRLGPEEQKHWLEAATHLLASSISPNMEPSGREFRRLIIPHFANCLQIWQSSARSAIFVGAAFRASASERFAAVYAEVGDWHKARELDLNVLSFREKFFGEEHPETLRIMSELGKVYWDLFDIVNCRSIRLKIYNTRLKVLGKDHPLTLSAITDLTATYWLAGDRKTSAEFGHSAVDGLVKVLGRDDPVTLTAMFHLSRTQLHLGRLEEARGNLVQVLEAWRNFFGAKHQDTLAAMAELGMVYHALKRMKESETLISQVLAQRVQNLGEEHAYTLWAINELCKIYTDSGRAGLALAMLDAMIPIVVRTIGEQHIGMAMTKFNLARAYNGLGRWKDGETVLRNQMSSIPPGHPDYVAFITELGWICKNMDRLNEAEEWYSKAMEAIKAGRSKGINVIKVRRIANELREVYQQQGQKSKADELDMEVAALIEESR
ncbi:Kinesin light chain [Hyphodiscus hymeniophilus]|uniref:Kinesin light chain n=1 Tax=Hyphodiscus hymeniophilus TaxID=353542 RepID=A0A9P6VJB7_9HELO|nr:Kinesin light chain [Hyphodiscus hymeniophilus]